MLYQLSYIGPPRAKRAELERETGIEPATNSLEGCDSAIELLPLLSSVTSDKWRARTREINCLARHLSLITVFLVDRGGFEPP